MRHKVDYGPGYRFFSCDECFCPFRQMSRHCESRSGSICARCTADVRPYDHERHYEWPTDPHGNLLFIQPDTVGFYQKGDCWYFGTGSLGAEVVQDQAAWHCNVVVDKRIYSDGPFSSKEEAMVFAEKDFNQRLNDI